MRLFSIGGFFAAALTVMTPASTSVPASFATKSLPTDRILKPHGQASSVVILLSSDNGWTGEEQRIADLWTGSGAVVVGVDLPRYYTEIAREQRDCHYLVSDIESIARQIHRAENIRDYHPPVVAGLGAGGTLALAIAAQTPQSTISATLAADPGDVIPLEKQLCTPAPKRRTEAGMIYGLTKGPLPNPITVLETRDGDAEGSQHAQALKKEHPDILVKTVREAAPTALAFAGQPLLKRLAQRSGPLDLPLVELPAEPAYDTMAVIYSGDGGWRDIDRQLGLYLQAAGVPVVGVDALRYFWNGRTPEGTAADLSEIMAAYRISFGVSRVALIGYSFGADVLPATYLALAEHERARIDMVSLLAPSRTADFEIAVSGWLGFAGKGRYGDPVADALEIPPHKLQCVYGSAETESGCLGLKPLVRHGLDLVERPGGHHFDGKYDIIADHILDRLRSI